ncbi:MAG: ribosome maturation factor RimP [Myxococcaceae bacterium]|nr:ribosome maturation factor RimP [Myxococcaceae bacterium]
MAEPSGRQSIEQKTRDVAGPIVAGEGMELLDVEYVREREGWVLRLFIDKAGGVGLEDCQQASRAVETALDVEDIIPQEYSLEVSSPGLNRPLTKPEHFKKVEGQTIKVKTYGPLFEPPRKNFTGKLIGVSEDGVAVDVSGAGRFDISFKDIAKANLEFDFDSR